MYSYKTLDDYGFPSNFSITSKKDVYNFLMTIDLSKNSILIKEKTFKKLFKQLYIEYCEFENNHPHIKSWKFNRKLWHFLQDDNELKIGICKVCCEKYTRFNSFVHGYHDYCSLKCVGQSSERMKHIEETNLARYGVKNPLQSKEIRKKIEETNLNKYGVKSPLQSKEIQDKWIETNLARYGCEFSISSKNVRDKIEETNLTRYGVKNVFQSEEIKQKIEETNLNKYGVKSPLQSKEIQDKWIETNLARYGCEFSINSEECRQKVEETNLARYGVKNVFQSEEIKQKIEETNLNKYGVFNYAQTHEFAKNHRKQINYDGLTFDSSWEVELYKYCQENNIPCEYQPNISFEYEYEGKIHVYQPDFLINGKIYEVKGDHFFEGDKMICPFDRSKDDLFETKHQCMLQNNVIILTGEDIKKLNNETRI